MSSTKASAVVELLVTLDRDGEGSLHHQLERQLREAIREGRLAAGSTMPSSRALAAELGVARGVVVEAYEQLIAEGYLLSRQGGSTRVAELPAPAPRTATVAPLAPDTIDLRPGRPDVTEFPRAAWARAARRVLGSAPSERFTYLEGYGVPELRGALVTTDALHASGADAVIGTPAHQYPTGAVMAPERRTELLAWARDGDRLVIEDDYDAEYRYDRDPVGALQGLDPEHVVYAGTASKSVAPGTRLAWMAVPPRLRKRWTAAKSELDHGSSAIEQLLLADAIAHGELDRHLRRMRAIYRSRRDAMLEALARHLPDWRPIGASAGLHLVAELPADVHEGRLIEGAATAGVLAYGLSRFRALPAEGGGVVLGYAATDERHIEQAIERLVGVAASAGT